MNATRLVAGIIERMKLFSGHIIDRITKDIACILAHGTHPLLRDRCSSGIT